MLWIHTDETLVIFQEIITLPFLLRVLHLLTNVLPAPLLHWSDISTTVACKEKLTRDMMPDSRTIYDTSAMMCHAKNDSSQAARHRPLSRVCCLEYIWWMGNRLESRGEGVLRDLQSISPQLERDWRLPVKTYWTPGERMEWNKEHVLGWMRNILWLGNVWRIQHATHELCHQLTLIQYEFHHVRLRPK